MNFIHNNEYNESVLKSIFQYTLKLSFDYKIVEDVFYLTCDYLDKLIYNNFLASLSYEEIVDGYFLDLYTCHKYIDMLCEKFDFYYEITFEDLNALKNRIREDYYLNMGAQAPKLPNSYSSSKALDILCTMEEKEYKKWIPTRHKPKRGCVSIGYAKDRIHYVYNKRINELAIFLRDQIKNKSLLSIFNSKK